MQMIPTSTSRGRRRAGLAAMAVAAIGLGALATPAKAQDWPQRGVRFILPFGAGSGTDVAARLIGERLQAKWGRPVIVDNRPGGDGMIAINAFLSANDDHVLLYASSASFIAHPYTQEKLTYDFERDMAPIAQTAHTMLSTAASAASGAKTVAEFVALSRKQPAKVNAAGAAGLPEFAVDALIRSEGLKITKVPYRDVVQAGNDLAADRIQFLMSSYAVVRPHVESGKAVLLSLGSHERTSLRPDVPSIVEAGYPVSAVETSSGFYGPRTMPQALRERIGADIVEALKDKTVIERITKSGQEVAPGGPDVLVATLKRQLETTAKVAKVLGMEKK